MRILVIRLGALGDFIQSFAPFAAIRAHHPQARITLLTTAPFAELARQSPWFDHVEVDARPDWWNLLGLRRLRGQLRGFDMVYDLQTSGRSSRYFRLAGAPPWSGIAAGCAMPHANPSRETMHTRERQREQLAMAGIEDVPRPDLSWLAGDTFEMPTPFALLVPGSAPGRPRKRWPAEHFGGLAAHLHGQGVTPVVLGSAGEAPLAAIIRQTCPAARDLTGTTTIADIAGLARRGGVAVGNDTGPMHLIAAVGCPCVVLFSADSDPALTAPRGPEGEWPCVLRVPDLADLSVARVAASLPQGH